MSKCVKLETKKYKSRDSPPYSAMDCKGAKLLGNDGQKYISKADKNGIYKWVKTAEKSKGYPVSGTTNANCSFAPGVALKFGPMVLAAHQFR